MENPGVGSDVDIFNHPGVMNDVSKLENRVQHIENDYQKLNIRVIQLDERHSTLERLMGIELRRIGDDVSRIGKVMESLAGKIQVLSERRNGDLATILGVTWAILVTIIGSLSWWVISHVMGGNIP